MNPLKMITSLACASFLLNGCMISSYETGTKSERYVSPQIQGESQRINLDEVEKAFSSTKGDDLNTWMTGFEKRVNEIYEGSEIVSIDATRETGKLNITGFVEKNKEAGFQPADDRLFAIEQTGDVTSNQMPYRVVDERGNPYHTGHYSLFDNPFIQALVLGQLLGAFGPRVYYTPPMRFDTLRDHRTSFRGSPAFANQKVANQNFNSRFKQRAIGEGLRSRNTFNRGYGTTPGTRRTWQRPSTRSFPSGRIGGRRWR